MNKPSKPVFAFAVRQASRAAPRRTVATPSVGVLQPARAACTGGEFSAWFPGGACQGRAAADDTLHAQAFLHLVLRDEGHPDADNRAVGRTHFIANDRAGIRAPDARVSSRADESVQHRTSDADEIDCIGIDSKMPRPVSYPREIPLQPSPLRCAATAPQSTGRSTGIDF